MKNLPYTTYSQYLERKYGPGKIQKIGLTIGRSCPNRDGTLSYGGCSYCNNASFTPTYQHMGMGVKATLEKGKEFFARKYPTMRYLAYFQGYTNTYGTSEKSLLEMYRQASAVEGIIGLVIATRPDMVPETLLDKLQALSRQVPVTLEFGAETSHDDTLRRVNRCHTWQDTVSAVRRVKSRGMDVGLHLIMGLPGESRDRQLLTVQRCCDLGVDTLKLHHLQIVKGTRLEQEYAAGATDIVPYPVDGYLQLCMDIVHMVPRSIAIERFVAQSPGNMLVAPRWGLKNHEFTHRLNNMLMNEERSLKC